MDFNLRYYEFIGVRWIFIVWIYSLSVISYKVFFKVYDSIEIIMFDKSKYWYMILCWVWKRIFVIFDEGY